MARNEEKQYGRLNRLILQKEKAEYEKKHPRRPRLDCLDTAEEVQRWLPSIKKDIDFFLKKSQVTCYSDEHVEECLLTVNRLEKEYKAFVAKLKRLTPGQLDAIPWTSRPYKRKLSDTSPSVSEKEFIPIIAPILEKEPKIQKSFSIVETPSMDKPLVFCPLSYKSEPSEKHADGSAQSTENVMKTGAFSGCSENNINLVNYSYSSDENDS